MKKASYSLLISVVAVLFFSLITQSGIISRPDDQVAQTGFFSVKFVAQKFQSGINFLGLGLTDSKTTVSSTKNTESFALLKVFFNLFDNPPDPTDPPPSPPPSWCQGEKQRWIPLPPPGPTGICVQVYNDFDKPGEISKFLEKGRVRICFQKNDGEKVCVDVYIKCVENDNGQFENCEITLDFSIWLANHKGSCKIEPPYDPDNNPPGTIYNITCTASTPEGPLNICLKYKDGKLEPASCDDPPAGPPPPGTTRSSQNY